jgi:hypothetical protein
MFQQASKCACAQHGGSTSIFLTVAICLLLLSACGGGESTQMPAAAPAGVDSELWQQLNAELLRVLEEQPARGVSTPPHGESAASRLTYSKSSSSLFWSLYSPGDYDQNGIVNISDLTPLGQNFGKVAPPGGFPESSLEAVVDGDGNGEINIADVTPIGANFGVQCTGYRVYFAPSGDGVPVEADSPNGPGTTWTDSVDFASSNTSFGRREFSLQVVPTEQEQLFWVRPTDGQFDGAASNAVAVSLPPDQPPVASLHPTGSPQTVAHIVWDASQSIDPDGEIVSYEWDFNGDGLIDHVTDGSTPQADFYYYAPGEYSVSVRVTDNNNYSDTVEAPVTIAQQETWQETIVDERRTWNNFSGNQQGIVGPTRILAVDGRPAMFYRRWQEESPSAYLLSMVYRIADNDTGNSWGPVQYVELDNLSNEAQGIRFGGAAAIVEGMPAVAYARIEGDSHGNDNYLLYKRAVDPAGSQWVTSTVATGHMEELSGQKVKAPRGMIIVNGFPALFSQVIDATDYVRATDMLSGLWAQPVNSGLSLGIFTEVYSYSPLNGMLARIELANEEDLLFTHSLDDNMQQWTDPAVLVDEHEKAARKMCLLEVGGKPGVVYKDDSTADMKYRLALDANGSDWREPVVLDPRAGERRLAAIVDGRPAVLYSDRISGTLKFIAANDSAGTYWSYPVDVDLQFGDVLDTIRDTNWEGEFSPDNLLVDIAGSPTFTLLPIFVQEDGQKARRLVYVTMR